MTPADIRKRAHAHLCEDEMKAYELLRALADVYEAADTHGCLKVPCKLCRALARVEALTP